MTPDPISLAEQAEALECRALSQKAWIRQARQHNAKSASLPGAIAELPALEAAACTMRWLADREALFRAFVAAQRDEEARTRAA